MPLRHAVPRITPRIRIRHDGGARPAPYTGLSDYDRKGGFRTGDTWRSVNIAKEALMGTRTPCSRVGLRFATIVLLALLVLPLSVSAAGPPVIAPAAGDVALELVGQV